MPFIRPALCIYNSGPSRDRHSTLRSFSPGFPRLSRSCSCCRSGDEQVRREPHPSPFFHIPSIPCLGYGSNQRAHITWSPLAQSSSTNRLNSKGFKPIPPRAKRNPTYRERGGCCTALPSSSRVARAGLSKLGSSCPSHDGDPTIYAFDSLYSDLCKVRTLKSTSSPRARRVLLAPRLSLPRPWGMATISSRMHALSARMQGAIFFFFFFVS